MKTESWGPRDSTSRRSVAAFTDVGTQTKTAAFNREPGVVHPLKPGRHPAIVGTVIRPTTLRRTVQRNRTHHIRFPLLSVFAKSKYRGSRCIPHSDRTNCQSWEVLDAISGTHTMEGGQKNAALRLTHPQQRNDKERRMTESSKSNQLMWAVPVPLLPKWAHRDWSWTKSVSQCQSH